jgi:hypothetical protein
VAGGCGIGPGGASEGQASLTVTRDYGTEPIAGGTLEGPTPSDTVVRFLDDNADIDTSYGGNFVETINGLDGSTVNGGPEDWFFFVNGIYSDVGAGETKVHPGDRVWWDYRRWSEAYRVPAVVGSWPEPFLNGYGGDRYGVVVECVATTDEQCEGVEAALDREGVEPEVEHTRRPVAHPDELRVLVGNWDALRADPAARMLEAGPGTSGVYGVMQRCGAARWDLSVLGSDAQPRADLESAGLVAAVRHEEDQPTWVVTATEPDALPDAVGLLGADHLSDRYAVAAGADGVDQPIPAADDLPAIPGGSCS